MSRSVMRRGLAASLFALLLTTTPTFAQTTYTWTGGDFDDAWFSPLNWSAAGPGSSPPLNSIVDTFVVLSGNNKTTNTLDYSFGTNSLTFSAGAGAFVIGFPTGDPQTLTIGAGGITVASGNTNNQTFNANLALGAAGTWANNGTGTFTVGGTVANGGFLLTVGGSGNSAYNGVISGTGGLTKTGTGTVTLGGVNTFSGPVVISGGVLQIASTNQILPSGTAAVTLNGGTLRHTGSAAVAFINTNHPIVIGPGGGTIDVPNAAAILTYTPGATATLITPAVAGTGVITKSGAGTLRLTNAGSGFSALNTVQKLVVTGGLWQGGVDTVFGAVPGSYLADAITLDGGGISANAGFAISTNRGITLGAAGGTLNAVATLTINSRIVGSGGLTTTVGAGNPVVITGLSTYTGPTFVSSGTLRAGAANALSAASAVTLNNAANVVLDLNNLNQGIGSLAGGGGTGGNVSLGSGVLTTGGNNTSTTFDGVISGAGGVTKAGTGTFTLTRANTYTGATTVSAGTLAIGTGGSLAAGSAVAVNNGGTLAGTGTVNGAITVASGGTLAAGLGGAGTLTVGGNTVLNSGSEFAVGVAASGTNSRVTVEGATTTFDFTTNSVLDLSLLSGFANATGATYTLVAMPSGGGVRVLLNGLGTTDGQVLGTFIQGTGASGAVSIAPSGFTFATGDTFTLTRSGDAVLLNFTPVPEPATTVLGFAVGALGLGGFVRRRLRRA